MEKRWKYSDIINLEYFFLMDRKNSSPEEARRRDRQIFLDLQTARKNGIKSDRQLILEWTETMAKRGQVPGNRISEIWKYLLYILAAAGFATGISAVSAVLYYRGNEPVNVAFFLVATVLAHWIFFLVLASRGLAGLISGKRNQSSYSPLYSFIMKVFVFFAEIALKAKKNRTGYEISDLKSFTGKFSAVYGNIFFWPVFVSAQIFGFSAAISSLAVTLARVAFTDLAFGWQSTINAAPERIHDLAGLAASPWKWFIPEGTGFPDASSIAGSRIILKDGILGLSTPDLASWWPFLCLCIIFYAVIPRFLMLVSGMVISSWIPEKFEFNHADCVHLLFRMRTPVFDSRPIITNEDFQTATEHEPAPVIHKRTGLKDARAALLVSTDILCLADAEKISAEILKSSGNRIDFTVSYSPGTLSEKKAMDELDEKINKAEKFTVCIFMEAWQPPILETTDFIKMIRNRIGADNIINIILTGRPMAGSMLTPPNRTDMTVWNSFINRLADPYILVTGATDAE